MPRSPKTLQPPADIDPNRLALIAAATPNFLVMLDDAGRIEWVNPSFEEHTGYRLEEIRGRFPKDVLYGPETDPAAIKRINQKLHRAEVIEEDILHYTRAGMPYWVHTYCIPIGAAQGVAPGYIAIQNNISDRKHSERGLRIAASVFDRSHEAILISDQSNRILDVNPAFSRITGYSRKEVLGLNPAILSSGRHSGEYYQSMWRSIEKTDHWRGEIWNRRKSGEEYVELLSISRVHLEEPGQYYHVAAFSDITALKNHARELDRAANYDDLTGLPNRQLLEERLRTARRHADRQHRSVSVCYLDLDGFKAINDRLGRSAGDQTLRTLSERLTRALRSGDTVARIGGDEFVLLLQGDDNHEAVYQRILATVGAPVAVGDQTITLTASLGITRYPDDGAEAEGLIRHAHQAMYSAKEKGRNQYHFFDPGLDEYRRHRRDQLVEITRALEHEEFELYFQPQIRITDGQLLGFEALIRWNHPGKGLVAPGQFLPIIENSHLEVPLGQWVLKEAIHQMNLWTEAGADLSVSINISAPHLMDRSFADYLESYLHSHPEVNAGQITLEVLESTALEDTKHASHVLARCQTLGLQVALDDFGTGFSSLTYLRTLPVDLIKIDQSFVRNMLDDASDHAIVESVIFLAQRFAHPVLAEGVETMEHARALRRMGCNFAQGYGIARPMPASEVLDWARQWQERLESGKHGDVLSPVGVRRRDLSETALSVTPLIEGGQPVRVKNHQTGHEGAVHKPFRDHEQGQITQVLVHQFIKGVNTTAPEHQAHDDTGDSHRNASAEEAAEKDVGEKVPEVLPALPQHDPVADERWHHHRYQAIGRKHQQWLTASNHGDYQGQQARQDCERPPQHQRDDGDTEHMDRQAGRDPGPQLPDKAQYHRRTEKRMLERVILAQRLPVDGTQCPGQNHQEQQQGGKPLAGRQQVLSHTHNEKTAETGSELTS